jgi:molybdopterin molybdotransferase
MIEWRPYRRQDWSLKVNARDDCFAFPQRRTLHSEALAQLQHLARALDATEDIDIRDATGRVVAQAVRAPRAVPAHTNAAVDGYAFAFDSYDANQGTHFAVGGRAAAGAPLQGAVPGRSAIRIFTGAIMPDDCDTVAMQEDCRLEAQGAVFIPAGLKRGANRRMAGEDTAEGATVVLSGQRLRPQDVAALASTGVASVTCFKRPRICFFSTGDEILPPGAPFSTGKVYDSNGPMLGGLFAPLNLTFTHGGILPDNREAVHNALHAAAENFDLIVTTGGASLGEEDHVVAALRAADALSLWQLAIKPGRPMGVGRIGSCLCFALPGNPVAVLVCALLYVWPAVRVLAGEQWTEPQRLPFRAGFEIKSRKPGRREFFRGWLESDDGQVTVQKYKRDGSGLISSLRSAGGLIEIPEQTESIQHGDTVSFIPFSAFGIF